MNFFIKKIVAPIGEYVIQQVANDLNVETIGERLRNFLVSNFFNGGVSAVVLFVFVIFFAFSIAKYFVAICVFISLIFFVSLPLPLVQWKSGRESWEKR